MLPVSSPSPATSASPSWLCNWSQRKCGTPTVALALVKLPVLAFLVSLLGYYEIIVAGDVLSRRLSLTATGFLPPAALTNQMFYIALFFAFATLFTNVEFLLFFVLPVKVWIFAMISLATILFSCLSFPPLFLTYGLAFFPYLVWAIPRLYHWRKYRNQVNARRVKFQSKSNDSQGQTLHRCVICNETELSNPQLDFRVAENGDEYCLDHLGDDGKPAAS